MCSAETDTRAYCWRRVRASMPTAWTWRRLRGRLRDAARATEDSYASRSKSKGTDETAKQTQTWTNKDSGSDEATKQQQQQQASDVTEALSSLVLAKSDADRADALLQRNLGFEDEDSLSMRKMALMVLFTILCRAGRALPKGASGGVGAAAGSTLQTLVSARERDFLLLSADELKRLADIACSEPEGTTEVARKMLQLAWQAYNRGVGADGAAEAGETGAGAYVDKGEKGTSLAATMRTGTAGKNCPLVGRIFCQMIELSSSRDDALALSQEFHQLVRNHSSAPTTMTGEQGQCSASSPYAKESIDQVTAVAYNYGVTLAELNQIPLAEQFINTAIGLMPYASPEIRQWSRRVEDSYLRILEASGPGGGSAAIAPGSGPGGAGSSAAPEGEETGIAKLFGYDAAGLAPALHNMASDDCSRGSSGTGQPRAQAESHE